ncbi:izumo sperm-egg fusion protein 1 [Eucyclogobius newberryi]|uniref:izumo sperm-egg fusion protein 1 n=1 Tax=Eucyclogobius newberryi TaxID=166745 RepID=UPI003B5C55EE
MFVLLLLLLLLVCSTPGVRPCLQCDPNVIKMFEKYFLTLTFSDYIRNAFYEFIPVAFKRKTSLDNQFIDYTTLYRASTEYQHRFKDLQDTPSNDPEMTRLRSLMRAGTAILTKHLEKMDLCPNKCGLLIRTVIDCTSCTFVTHTCPTGQKDCGETQLVEEEGDQAVLDCFLPWHQLVLGKPEYHYSWAPAVLEKTKLEMSDFKEFLVTRDSALVLNQLDVRESGTYQCLLKDTTGTVLYKVTWVLSVTALPTKVPKPVKPFILPDMPYVHHKWRDALEPVLYAVIACCLAASLGLSVLIVMLKRQKAKTLKEGNLWRNL